MPNSVQLQRVIYPGAGGIVAPAGTMLDTLITQGASVVRAYSVRKVRTAYSGNCATLRGNGTGTPEANIPFAAGALDKSAAAALIASGGGTAAYWKNLYDQSVNASHATQFSATNQVIYGTGIFATGALGDANSAQTNCWLDFSSSGITQPYSIWTVCSFAATAANRTLVGSSTAQPLGLIESAGTRNLTMYWGTQLSAATAPSGLVNVLGVANGASSKIWVGGVQKAVGNSGTTIPATMRIGSNSTPNSNNWFGVANNTIAEVIIFGSDPTGLAGWANFVADAKTYFGTA